MPGRDSDNGRTSRPGRVHEVRTTRPGRVHEVRTTRPEYRPSEKVRAILAVAASSPEFLEMLVKHREKALARMGLSEEDKAALLSLPAERIVKMARRSQQEKGPWRALRSRALLIAGIVVALVALQRATSYGPARRAQAALVRISVAESMYRADHRTYGSLGDLTRSGVLSSEWVASELAENEEYEFEVTVDGDSFAATARDRTSPETEPGFRVGPDGEVEALE
jgi:hypothetical protein